MGDYSISDIYQGGYDSLDPNKGAYFTGFHAKTSDIGTSVNPQTANQLGEINKILNQGYVPIEMGSLSGQIFESIPKQHFKEIGRVANLTGSKVSLHAPIQDIEVSGITQDGWSEGNRLAVENQLKDVIQKSFELDRNGGVPITIHSTALPGSIYQKVDGEKQLQKIIAINQETYKMAPLEIDEKYRPEIGLSKQHIMSPEAALRSTNQGEWDNTLSSIGMQQKTVSEIIQDSTAVLAPLYTEGKGLTAEAFKNLTPEQSEAINKIDRARMFVESAELGFMSAFNKAAKYSKDERDREVLEQISQDWKKNLKELSEKGADPVSAIISKNNLIDDSLRKIQQVSAPEVFTPIEDFSLKKSAETFANVALESYKFAEKVGKDPSKICIENMSPGMAFSDAKGMNALVEESRKRFVEEAVKNKIMSESEAKKKSQEIIGVTFDLGHLNIGKKYGFDDKDMVKEAEAMAKNVKHVHLADNFGYNDSHLPPGMGNVPNKAILEKLEKAGFSGRKIVEAGGFINQFRESPFIYSLEGLGAPMYRSGGKSYWNTSYGLTQGYFGGYGNMLPQQNYNMFGAGFSMLPQELGGNIRGGGNSRMGGNPLE